jgi:hypothetical protein
METTQTTFENHPLRSVCSSNLVSLSIYGLGALIINPLGWIFTLFFLLYCLALEIRLLKKSCVNCYYYGKRCFSGKGLLCSFFFKKGDPKKFLAASLSWKELLPDFLVALIPLSCGLVLSIIAFSWLRVGWMLLLLILGFPVTGYIRGTLACLHCKQREIGCPASAFFSKKKG